MRFLIAIVLFLAPAAAFPWTPAGDRRIAEKGADLAPPDLRMLIRIYEPQYRAGLERARLDEGSDTHRYLVASRSGRLRDRIERETAAAISMIRKGEPMSAVVERLGGLVHLVADANNPFHIADDPRLAPMHEDYESYFEQRMARFPTVFYGLDPHFRIGQYLDRTFARTAKFQPLVREEYFRGGTRRNSSHFDDRSTAFGIASICYSRAVTDVVNLYYYIWREAGGDVRTASVMRSSNLLLNAD
ncbi:MAG TPA: hypothetical protein VNL91_08670 [Thermoanaerobaculia bacterium]|nr:hypothetical protein [Thermoanaerobaculia bacterium]